MNDIFTKIATHTQTYAQDLYDFASELIKVESCSGNERGVAELVTQKMQQLGFDDVTVDAMGNVRGSVGKGETLICADGHMDVVGAGDESQWSRSPFSGDQDDKHIYGRGASDMKAAIASMVYAGKVVQDLQLTDSITFMVCATVQEEPCEGLAWEYLIEKEGLNPDFVIIAEPSDDLISLAQKGRMELKVSVSGKSAHASAPHMGNNAIYAMAAIVSELEQLNDNLEIEDKELGKGSLVVSDITSNAPSRSSVADFCEIFIDRRLTWGESPQYALEQIQQLPSVIAAQATVTLHTFEEPSYTGLVPEKECTFPAWKIEKDHVVTRSTVEAYEKLFNKAPTLTTWPFSTNGVAIMGKHNIPVIGYGPGVLAACHVPDEYVEKEQVLKAAMMYAAMCLTYATNKQ
ncbi:YgeY family selenium metabolism-linked hydrolase [Halodesulfovibrio spirochaetisodalis]|uniref:YgeY family selenium metabolism-linked hydrolase n=1 Tax=Halodesulfovibrio spirochaetisodalis TaxID=1560234 RepID=UPI00082CFB39|nr:YgeY family selenium metabolism-linked hydrolase [Halodesulfovibrio spirochaetisodalis]